MVMRWCVLTDHFRYDSRLQANPNATNLLPPSPKISQYRFKPEHPAIKPLAHQAEWRYVIPSLEENSYNIKADIYSLGVTLYEMITGHLPYEGNSLAEIIGNMKSKLPSDPKKFFPNISNDLSTIVLAAIGPATNKRYT